MTSFPSALTTDRLHLRRAQPSDATDVFEYASDSDTAKYMTFPRAQTLDDVTPFLESIQPLMDADSEYHWAIELVGAPTIIGIISLRRLHGLEIGYCMNRTYWGNGYMPKAARALIAWAQTNEPFQRIWATCDIDNEKSAAVLQKIGMTEEGVLRHWALHPNISDKPRDCRAFSLP